MEEYYETKATRAAQVEALKVERANLARVSEDAPNYRSAQRRLGEVDDQLAAFDGKPRRAARRETAVKADQAGVGDS